MERAQTHTYWMTFEEYEKWSFEKGVKKEKPIKSRTHIFFV